jgi:hypothetical protein
VQYAGCGWVASTLSKGEEKGEGFLSATTPRN